MQYPSKGVIDLATTSAPQPEAADFFRVSIAQLGSVRRMSSVEDPHGRGGQEDKFAIRSGLTPLVTSHRAEALTTMNKREPGNFRPSPHEPGSGHPLKRIRHAGLLVITVCCIVLSSLALPQMRSAEYFEPGSAWGREGLAAPQSRSLAEVMDTYTPSIFDLADGGTLILRCGTEEAMRIAGPVQEPSTVNGASDVNSVQPEADTGFSEAASVTIDVMILYTTEKRLLCGQARLEDIIHLSIACANETFRRSHLRVELRLVYLGEARGYEESGELYPALHWLKTDQTVATLRDKYGADLVSMVVSSGKFAGIANRNGSHSVYRGHPIAFTHEVGHNLGCNHARQDVAYSDDDAFSFAHVFIPPNGPAHTYCTIMSKDGSLILNFSNPRVTFRGGLTGLPEGHRNEEGKNNSADNARTIAETAPEVAARKPTHVASLESLRFDHSTATFSFDIVSHQQATYSVECTEDFVSWTPLGVYDTDAGRTKLSDNVSLVRARFYRAHSSSGVGVTGAIGFYHRTVPTGYSLITNQLHNEENLVETLFAEMPEGTALYKWDAFREQYEENIQQSSGWTRPGMSLHPGEGALLRTDEPLALTFVGKVQPAVYKPVYGELSLVTSPFPQAGPIRSALHFPLGGLGQNTEIFKLTGDPSCYERSTHEGGTWQPESEPYIEIGEAFWSHVSPNGCIWKRVLLPWESEPAVNELAVKMARSSDSLANLTIQGEIGAVYQIEGSSDLVHWTILATVTNEVGRLSWTDPEAGLYPTRFYRAAQVRP